ncbi:MAG: hypothetical protein K8R39_11520, partial [Arcobacteraceae bacterium]|nr:hypothetical protein [Arcobacteraceae bacterium]
MLTTENINKEVESRLKNLNIPRGVIDSIVDSRSNLTSAHAIASTSKGDVIKELKQHGLNNEKANKVYENSHNIKNAISHYIAAIHNNHNLSSPKMVQNINQTEFENLPSYDELFGSLDYLNVKHDQSIFSPAAYLVDLLRVVDNYIEVGSKGISLDTRRADIKQLTLNLENTEHTVPFLAYINKHILLKKDGITLKECYEDKKFPFAFPMSSSYNASFDYADALKSSLSELYLLFGTKDFSWALVVLKICYGDSFIGTNDCSVEDYYKENIDNLKKKNIFLKQTELTWQELDELFTQSISNTELIKEFYINRYIKEDGDFYWQVSEDNTSIKIVSSDDETIYKHAFIVLQVFIRLSRRLNISFQDCDALLRSINISSAFISEQDMINIANIVEVQNYFDISLQEVCALISPINTIGSENLYNKIFGDIELENFNLSFLSTKLKISQNYLEEIELELQDMDINKLSQLYRLTLLMKKFHVNFKTLELLNSIANNKTTISGDFTIGEINNLTELYTWIVDKDFSPQELLVCMSEDNLIINNNELNIQTKEFLNYLCALENLDNEINLRTQMSSFLGIDQNILEPAFIFLYSKKEMKLHNEEELIDTLKRLYRYILLVSKLDMDITLAQSIVDDNDNKIYNIAINNLKLQDIQNLYALKELKVNNKNQFISNLQNNNFDAIAVQMNWLTLDVQSIQESKSSESYLKQFIYMQTVFSFSIKLGCSLTTLKTIHSTLYHTNNDSTSTIYNNYETIFNELKNLFLAKYKGEVEQKVQNIENRANELLRNALLSNIRIKNNLKNDQEISEYLLVDTMQSNCSLMSPIKEATLAVQTYINRCKTGLEEDTVSNIPEAWGEWLMAYRVWEANRKVFLYPENYIEPSLRPNQTELFKKLEQDLMQQDLSTQTIEEAYYSYMKEFFILGNLVHLGTSNARIKRPSDSKEVDTLIVFARTNTTPYRFFYQLCYTPYTKISNWQEWKEINNITNTDKITMIYSFNKLYVFWVEHMEKKIRDEENKEIIQQLFSIKYIYQEVNSSWSAPQYVFENKEFNDCFEESGILKQEYRKVGLINSYNKNIKEEEIIVLFAKSDKQIVIQNRTNISSITIDKDDCGLENIKTEVKIEGKMNQASTTVKNYIFFAGGLNNLFKPKKENSVDIVTINDQDTLIKIQKDELKLSKARSLLSSTTLGDYAIFSGGKDDKGENCADIDIFQVNSEDIISKVENHGLKLSKARWSISSTTLGDYAIFAGGENDKGESCADIDIFQLNSEGVISKVENHGLKLSKARSSLSSTTLGDYAIFA